MGWSRRVFTTGGEKINSENRNISININMLYTCREKMLMAKKGLFVF